MTNVTNANVNVIREVYGRVVYSHKTHEKAREIDSGKARKTKYANIFLNALTFGGVVTAGVLGEGVYLWASLVVATTSLGFMIYQLSFDPTNDAARHRAAAKSLLAIRERYINLLADIENGLSDDEIRVSRDELQAELSEIYDHAPDTSAKAYEMARVALQLNEELTFSDTELDLLLPASLRVTIPPNSA